MCAAMFTFTACSSDDGGDGAQNPVSSVTVPSTAKVGSSMTIQGTGFDASGIALYLVDAAGTKTQLSGKFLSSGATITVPMTLATGSYSVVLSQGGNDFTLGTVSLTEPDNPITSASMPEGTVAPNATATLGGSGYADGDIITLTAGTDTLEASNVAIGSDGSLSFTVPDCDEGEYTVTLARGAYSWELGTVTVEKVWLVDSVNFICDMLGVNSTFTFEYDSENRVTRILSDGEEYAVIDYDKGTITGPDPYGSGTPTTLTFADGRVTSSSSYDYWAYSAVKYDWTYDADGHLSAIGDEAVSFTGNNLTDFSSIYKFGYSTEKIHSNTFDPAIAMLLADLFGSRDDILIASMCNLAGKSSINAPNEYILVGQYTEDGETFTDLNLPITISNSSEKLQMTYMLQGLAETVITINYKEASAK